MEWIITAGLVLNLAGLVWTNIKLAEVKQSQTSIRVALTARQTRVKQAEASKARPHIDSKAKTTIRDTDDLPRTGRMGPTLSRKNSDARGQDQND